MDEPQQPRVTALIVSRNNGAILRSCLEALEASAGRDRLEVLVVDDGSRDETADVTNDFPEVISLRLPKRLGWTRAVNIGLRTAKGEAVLLLPVEYRVHAETVTALADRLDASPETGAVCPRIEHTWSFPTADALMQAWRTSGELPGAQVVEGEMATDYPRGSPILVRRELFRAMNYLDKRFGQYWSDLEMCWRIRDGNKSIIVAGAVPVDRSDLGAQENSELEQIDSAHGIATWIGLHYGFAAGLRCRIQAALHALGKGRMGAAMNIVSGSKIDGNQE